MRIPFRDIATSGSRYTITDDTWLARTDLQTDASPHAEITLTRKDYTRIEVDGELRTGVLLVCDRCLAEYSLPVRTAFHFILEAAPETEGETHTHIRDMECSGAEMDIIRVQEPTVDISDILGEQVYLSLPVKQICSADCRGLCPSCGENLNTGQCCCPQTAADSPFAVLANLKKA
ncbi:MAG: YceD family protein [Candidatus Electrothrix sp. YB6]